MRLDHDIMCYNMLLHHEAADFCPDSRESLPQDLTYDTSEHPVHSLKLK